ncbi:hypothetical protein [Nocardioides coralli]|uniref:hypothetical protein n=1 Tax=Nocardioides coralli TaxID=2872154 RepID=UPI001CA429C3|nr:hypothetical protein [Nocardioides coralli]QZY28735.1 hypothetical protein K6T13_14925 [Nocardioides coralli]
MHMRRSLALVSGALLLATPLTSCGFDLATDRVNTITAGTSDRDASVDVLNAVVVSDHEGSGTFIATFVNNDTESDATIEAVESGAAEVSFTPIQIAAGGLLNLAQAEEEDAVTVEGDLAAGGVVPMQIQVSGGELVDLDVPVVPACDEWEGLDVSGDGGATSSEDTCEIEHEEGAH